MERPSCRPGWRPGVCPTRRRSWPTISSHAPSASYTTSKTARKIKLYGGVLVPQAEELVGASETAYATGTIDFLNLIDAEQTLLRFRLQHERALANRQQRLAELEMLIGADLSDGPPSLPSD